MKQKLFKAALVGMMLFAAQTQAAVHVLATSADWASLTNELGGDKVDVYSASTAFQDIHRIEAKPSLVARARNAQLIVATGAELEIGWLPVLLQESGNARVQPGSPGYFEATSQVRLLEVPARLDRSMGDVHPDGNPHLQLDPRNVAAVAKGLTSRLIAIDSANSAYYQSRGDDFQKRWQAATVNWEQRAASLKGVGVVVIHRDQSYLLHWLGLREIAPIEPKPGVPPSAGYLSSLISKLASDPPRMILRNAYNDSKSADWLSARVHAPVVLLPFSVGGTPAAKDLFGLFDDTVTRLLEPIK
jgi:zinc/manganese transport system substrate-binding protein